MHLNLPEGNGADFFGAIAPHATHPVVKLSVEDVLPQIETCKTTHTIVSCPQTSSDLRTGSSYALSCQPSRYLLVCLFVLFFFMMV